MDKKYTDAEIEVVEVEDVIVTSNNLPIAPGGGIIIDLNATGISDYEQTE